MSNQKYEYLIAQVDLFNAWADSEGFDIKMSSETEHSSKETHLAFLAWIAGKAQAVPEAHIVVPRNREVVVAIEKMVEQQVEASGITSDVFRLDGWRILDAIQEASESGVEG